MIITTPLVRSKTLKIPLCQNFGTVQNQIILSFCANFHFFVYSTKLCLHFFEI